MAKIVGGIGNDTLVGTSAADRLYGLAGSDSLRGGAGNDYYFINSTADRIDEQGATSTADRVIATISINMNTLGAGLLENAQVLGKTNLSIVGNAKANSIVGNVGQNTLSGGSGNDTIIAISGNDKLVGGAGDDILNGGAGNNLLLGGKGNDSYFYNGSSDKIDEQGATSLGDRVNSSVSVNLNTLAAGLIEHVFLVGSANLVVTGNAAANSISGNLGDNTLNGGANQDSLSGGAGNDVLNGGAGGDQLAGGLGNDTFIVDNALDQVSDDGGIDLVKTSVSVDLSSGFTGIENVTLTGNGSIHATGNDSANVIIGNSGSNSIQGGAGNDSLDGGAGSDFVQGGADADTLTGGAGSDGVSGGKGNDTILLDSDTNVADIYSYHAGDLDGGAIDTFQGKMDSSLLIAPGDDIIDIGDLIALDNGVAARDEIWDFITKSADGAGGLIYSIDLDGGEAASSPVQFLHFVQIQLPVWFQADNEQQAI